MEAVYQKADCVWVSEEICLREYFASFSAAVPTVSSCENRSLNTNGVDETNTKIMKLMDVPFTEDEMKILSETCRCVYVSLMIFLPLCLECR
jgi:hypothetical protein